MTKEQLAFALFASQFGTDEATVAAARADYDRSAFDVIRESYIQQAERVIEILTIEKENGGPAKARR